MLGTSRAVVTTRPEHLFDQFNFDTSFLNLDVARWKDDEGFCAAEKYFKNLLVTNDTAERGVKLATDFIATMTKNPHEFQDLLQVVEHNRKLIPDDKKSSVKNTYLDFPI